MLKDMTNRELMNVEGGSVLVTLFCAGFAAGIAMGVKKWFK
ncbi:class IIb bacteriocin, lactobin A/cerein 7B family [Howardella ureilytica]